jgi:hypothetical protein
MILGSPSVKATALAGKLAAADTGAPLRFWHLLQWQ